MTNRSFDQLAAGDYVAVMDHGTTGRYVTGIVDYVSLDRETLDVDCVEVIVRDASGRRFIEAVREDYVETEEGKYTVDRAADWRNRYILGLSV